MNTQDPNLVIDISQRNYTVVDNWLFEAPLSAYEKLVFIALKKYAWAQSKCFPSLATLSQDTSTSQDTVERAIKSLIKKGLVKRISGKQKGLANVYVLGPFDDPAEGTAIGGRGTAIGGRGTANSGRGTANSGRGTANSGRGVPLIAVGGTANSGTNITHRIDKNLSLSSIANETRKDDLTSDESQNERDREIFLIFDSWKKIFGAAPPEPCPETIKKMDYMLVLSREGKISPRAPLAYLKKMSAPPAEFTGIAGEIDRERERKAAEEASAEAEKKKRRKTTEKNAAIAAAWQALSEAEKARYGSFLKFRVEWNAK